jgi:hypothetical protein
MRPMELGSWYDIFEPPPAPPPASSALVFRLVAACATVPHPPHANPPSSLAPNLTLLSLLFEVSESSSYCPATLAFFSSSSPLFLLLRPQLLSIELLLLLLLWLRGSFPPLAERLVKANKLGLPTENKDPQPLFFPDDRFLPFVITSFANGVSADGAGSAPASSSCCRC